MMFNSVLGRTIYPIKKISEGCNFLSGYAFKGTDFTSSGIPIIKIKNIQNGKVTLEDSTYVSESVINGKLERFQLQAGDILIAMTGQGSVGRVGKLYISNSTAPYLNQRVGKFIPDEKNLNRDFLYYVISTRAYEQLLFAAGSGSGQPNLSPATIMSVEIPYPPYEIQCGISKILGDIDDKIHLNTQTNQTLESIAQAIFKSWFVDFEPVKAKMAALAEGGTREQAELAAMGAISGKSEAELAQLQQQNPEHYQQLAETAALFPSAMVESELGEIPEGWEVKPIYGICNVIYGAPFKSSLFNTEKSGLPLVRIRDLKDESPGVYTEESHPKGYLIQNCDLITGMDGEFRSYIWGGNEAWMNQRICCFKPKAHISTYLLKGFIDPHLNKFEKTATATTVIHLGKGDIDTFSFLDAGENIFRAFNTVTENLIFKLVTNKLENLNLSQLRDSLLPKLLSGEIDLSDIQSEVA